MKYFTSPWEQLCDELHLLGFTRLASRIWTLKQWLARHDWIALEKEE
jgi:hypothetical protein